MASVTSIYNLSEFRAQLADDRRNEYKRMYPEATESQTMILRRSLPDNDTVQDNRESVVAATELRVKALQKALLDIKDMEALRGVSLIEQSFREFNDNCLTWFLEALDERQFAKISCLIWRNLLDHGSLEDKHTTEFLLLLMNSVTSYTCLIGEAGNRKFVYNSLIDIVLSYLNRENIAPEAKTNHFKESLLRMCLSICHNIMLDGEMAQCFSEKQKPNAEIVFKKFLTYDKDDVIKCLACLCCCQVQPYSKTFDKDTFDTLLNYLDAAVRDAKGTCRGISKFSLAKCVETLVIKSEYQEIFIKHRKCAQVLNELLKSNGSLQIQECGIDLIQKIVSHHEGNVIANDCYQALTKISEKCEDSRLKKKAGETVKLVNDAKRILTAKDDELKNTTSPKKSAVAPAPQQKHGHVMLSYSWAQQAEVQKIRKYLGARNIDVWIDTERMGDELYDGMAEGVMNASVVCICYSSAYYKSPRCKSEAAMAQDINKKVIAVLMEKDYKPKSWLFAIIAGKIYKHFYKTLTEDLLEELYKSIKDHFSTLESSTTTTATISSGTQSAATNSSAPKQTSQNQQVEQVSQGRNSCCNIL